MTDMLLSNYTKGRTIMKTIGEKLKQLRENAKLSQKQLSSYLNIDQSYLSKIESNERPVNVEILEKLAILYGIELSDFDKPNICSNQMKFSLRSKQIDSDDLKSIADINVIAANTSLMAKLLEDIK